MSKTSRPNTRPGKPVDDTAENLTAIRKSKGPRGGLATAFAAPVSIALAILLAATFATASPAVARIGCVVVAAVAWIAARAAAAPVTALLADVDALSRGGQPRGTSSGSSDVVALSTAIRSMWTNLKRGERLRKDLIDAGRDVRAAAALFERQRPTSFPMPEGLSVHAAHRTAGALGGTLVGAHATREGRALVCLLGASGDGTAAALLLASARAYAKALAPDVVSPRRFLKDLNALLAPELPGGTFVTAAVVLVEPSSGSCLYASAGHRVAALRVKPTGSARRLQSEGIALGFEAGPVFDRSLEEASFFLDPDEVCLLASEGLAAATVAGATVGEAGIARAAVRTQADDDVAARVIDAIGSFEHSADATLVVVRRTSPGDRS